MKRRLPPLERLRKAWKQNLIPPDLLAETVELLEAGEGAQTLTEEVTAEFEREQSRSPSWRHKTLNRIGDAQGEKEPTRESDVPRLWRPKRK